MNGRSGAALAQPTGEGHGAAAPQAELEGLIGQLDEALGPGYFHPPERTG